MADQYLIVEHLTLKEIQRFFSKVAIDPLVSYNGTPCWLWTGYRLKKSDYGRVTWHQISASPHQLMYAWVYGPVPIGSVDGTGKRLEIDHLCRTHRCCNPAHLELVTRQVNVERGLNTTLRGKEKCPKGHALTPENIYTTKGKRPQQACLECYRRKARDYYHKRRIERPGFLARIAARARELRTQNVEQSRVNGRIWYHKNREKRLAEMAEYRARQRAF